MLSHGIFSVLLLILSNIFMTFAWYGHLKMREYRHYAVKGYSGSYHSGGVHRILRNSFQDGA